MKGNQNEGKKDEGSTRSTGGSADYLDLVVYCRSTFRRHLRKPILYIYIYICMYVCMYVNIDI